MVPLALRLPGIEFSPVKLLILLALWGVTLWRLPTALRTPGQRPLWTAFAGVAGLATLGLPGVGPWLDRAAGVHNLVVLLEHLLGLIACSAGLTFCGQTARPELTARLRNRHRAALLASQLALVLCFAALRRPVEVTDFYQAYPHSWAACLYALIVVGYLGAAMAAGTVLFGTYARRAGARALRTGLAVLALGTGTGFAYAVLRGWQILLETAGRPMFLSGRSLYRIEWTATALVLLGSLIPALGAACRGLRDRRTVRRLRPLWTELTAAVPEVVLGERLGRGPRLRLHRLVIEIRDAALVLAPYAGPAVRDHAAAKAARSATAPAQRAALTEAYWLRTALARHADGTHPADPAPPPPPDTCVDLDFDRETERLLSLAAAFARARPLTGACGR
ncbi:MAB_1171c family putative transporter [Kitasatospora sp. NPDC006697]|uniref:MAB_1171c family putative transporter n=1 Tax=Kitasatospora sp. NPDC006697 TaxID=3364020 RepID=UPI003686CF0A